MHRRIPPSAGLPAGCHATQAATRVQVPAAARIRSSSTLLGASHNRAAGRFCQQVLDNRSTFDLSPLMEGRGYLSGSPLSEQLVQRYEYSLETVLHLVRHLIP